MNNILVTGATGNVGQAVVKHFKEANGQRLFVATRDPNPAENEVYLDFADPGGSRAALRQTDVLFLLRPPQLADTDRYFKPLVRLAEEENVAHVVFLSVQGAEKNPVIPHAQIEKLLADSRMGYTFIRPSYFMQNLATTLLDELKTRDRIFLPAGHAPFLWVDVEDIGKAIAAVLQDPRKHAGRAYTITGDELHNFYSVTEMLSEELDRPIRYESPSPFRFFAEKKQEGTDTGYILVMIMLHYLPRFQKHPKSSAAFRELTGERPGTLRQYIARNRQLWLR